MAAQKVIPQIIESFLMKMRVIGLSELCAEGRSPPNDHLYDERISCQEQLAHLEKSLKIGDNNNCELSVSHQFLEVNQSNNESKSQVRILQSPCGQTMF